LTLTVNGRNFQNGATLTVDDVAAKKLKFKVEVTTGSSSSFNRIVGSKGVHCSPTSRVKVTNLGGAASEVFQLNQSCP